MEYTHGHIVLARALCSCPVVKRRSFEKRSYICRFSGHPYRSCVSDFVGITVEIKSVPTAEQAPSKLRFLSVLGEEFVLLGLRQTRLTVHR